MAFPVVVLLATLASCLAHARVLQLEQLGLEVRLQPGAVVALEGAQLVDLLLQQVTLATQLRKHRGLRLLGLGDHPRRALTSLRDHLLVPGAGLGDERIVLRLSGGQELIVLSLTGRQELLLLRLGLTNHSVVLSLPLADESFASALTFGHILFVQLLRQRQDTSRRFVPVLGSSSRG